MLNLGLSPKLSIKLNKGDIVIGLFLPLWCLAVFIGLAIVSAIVVLIFFVLDEMNIIRIKQKDGKFAVRVFFVTMFILILLVMFYYLLTPFYLA